MLAAMVPTICTREKWRFFKKKPKKWSLPTYNMVATMVATICTRENWILKKNLKNVVYPPIYTREYWRFKKNLKKVVYPPTIWSRPSAQGNIEYLKESKKCSLPTYNMVATMVPTIYTREMKYFTHLEYGCTVGGCDGGLNQRIFF